MSQLAITALIAGSFLFLCHLFPATLPSQTGAWIRSFPRSLWPGRLLAAADVAWVAILLMDSGIQMIERYQSLVPPAALFILVLIVIFMDELLAARALGGLFLLVPAPILEAAFIHPSNARLVMTVFAYILAILGIILVWSPFMLRKMTAGWINKPGSVRAAGLAGCAIGLGMILLGVFIY